VAFELVNEDLGYDGVVVLPRLSLSIETGDRVALVGENGAGKSTLLAVLQERYGTETAFIPQYPSLVETLTVFHNIYIGSLHRHSAGYNLLNLAWPRKREIEIIRAIAEDLGLVDKLFARAGELSGGQQQRVAVARAILHGGDAVFGDEPVSAADSHRAHVTLKAIGEAFETVVLSMHDVDLALRYATRIIGIKGGGIVVDEPTGGVERADLDFLYAG
jgi:phosphonate transport system ATP-binding protein